ncbi:hypothetical protein BJF93_06470 [Xaviernesmea oryzae]|uniref:Glycosyltransferase 2-like domain-containing protein n=1 Tax=Xaviernesmea oryzae TaxID=464029 RepID=A0A1Q9ASA8_9HYPH|nr:glycosyltransferase family A protein [Xaviernesmea oryzae]OLP58256.1 hypothetical protein BJF93_06470 [Xaviernesmea oryzae]SEL44621.1 Glycosyl transferase family 2 [Xaviernesmea oryzae]
MFPRPKLTVCVPSRNRQRTFKETIRALLLRPRIDVQFVFADNSDDASIMDDFMADHLADPRVVYLRSQDTALSMVDNWNRCVEAAEGEFVCMIGDDDYVDVNMIDTINRIQEQDPTLDAFCWNRLTYNWPGMPRPPSNVHIKLEPEIRKIARGVLYAEFFGWRALPSSARIPMGFYHGAISMALMDSFKERFGSYCSHPTVDFDNVCKVVSSANGLYFSSRPFSVMGACAESNSAAIYNSEGHARAHAQFMKELGRNMDEDPYMKLTPFRSEHGLAASILQVQLWFTSTFGYQMVDGWEQGFAKACALNAQFMDTKDSYDRTIKNYRQALRKWHGGKYLPFFKPEPFVERYGTKLWTGMIEGDLFIHERIDFISTPRELYDFVEQIVARPEDLVIEDHSGMWQAKSA